MFMQWQLHLDLSWQVTKSGSRAVYWPIVAFAYYLDF